MYQIKWVKIRTTVLNLLKSRPPRKLRLAFIPIPQSKMGTSFPIMHGQSSSILGLLFYLYTILYCTMQILVLVCVCVCSEPLLAVAFIKCSCILHIFECLSLMMNVFKGLTTHRLRTTAVKDPELIFFFFQILYFQIKRIISLT